MDQKNIGISDIASSEGDLLDFMKIIWIMGDKKVVKKNEIMKKFHEMTGSKSKGSFERKLSIMEKLDLIELVSDKYLFNSWGKILNKIMTDYNKMDKKLKAFFFELLFSSITRNQMAVLLRIIDKQHGKQKKELLQDYFSTEIARSIWSKKILEKNIKNIIEEDSLPSMFNNKFSCMFKWLNLLDLAELKMGGYYPKIRQNIVNSLNKIDRIENIFEDAAKIYLDEFRFFNEKQDYEQLTSLLRDSHKIFCTSDSGLSDIQAVSKFISLEFFEKKIILEQKSFFELTGKLQKDGIIRSVMAGRKGIPINMRLV